MEWIVNNSEDVDRPPTPALSPTTSVFGTAILIDALETWIVVDEKFLSQVRQRPGLFRASHE